MTSNFEIPASCCRIDEGALRKRIEAVPGVRSVTFEKNGSRVTVDHEEADIPSLVTAIEGSATCHGGSTPHTRFPLQLGVAACIVAFLEVLTLMGTAEGSWPIIGLSLTAILLGGRNTLKAAWASVRSFRLDVAFLMSLAVVGAGLLGEWGEAAVVCVLFEIAEWLEVRAAEKANRAIRSTMAATPDLATLFRGSEWVDVPIADVKVGDVVRIRPGQRVPLDGQIVSGSSALDEAAITGESVPKDKGPSDRVFAGTANITGILEVRVETEAGATTLDRVIQMVEESQAQKAPSQRFVDQFARIYTPSVVALALGIATIPPLAFGGSWSDWIYRGLVALVVSCPCALVLSTPVTIVSAIASAARRGVIVKGGLHLERSAGIDSVAFDKTGTLTTGQPVVSRVVVLNGQTSEAVLRIAASLNHGSDHPLARALKSVVNEPMWDVVGFRQEPGVGVSGTVGGAAFVLGNPARLPSTEGSTSVVADLERAGETAVVLTRDEAPIAAIGFADKPRNEAAEALWQLHALGMRTAMLTGDSKATAEAVNQKLGTHSVHAGLLPEDKRQVLSEMASGKAAVAMVGDGINDAPALASSHVGIAMGHGGTQVALDTADVVLLRQDLRAIPEFLKLSKSAMSVLKQNIAFAVGTKLAFFGLAIGGVATLWMGVFADIGVSLLVVANGLRLLRWKPK